MGIMRCSMYQCCILKLWSHLPSAVAAIMFHRVTFISHHVYRGWVDWSHMDPISALMHWRWLKLECYSKAGSLERRKLIKLPPLDLWELWQHWQSITLSLDRSLSCQSCSFPLSCCVLFRTIGSIQNCTTLVSKKDNYRTSKQPLIRYHVTVTNTRWMKLISPCDWIAFLIIQSWWTVNFQLHSFILGLHVIYIYYRIIVIYYYYSSCHYTGPCMQPVPLFIHSL